jgi:predicted ArsR family transcriptional regulator
MSAATRQKILGLFERQKRLSADEIHRELSVSKADVQYHLERFLQQGLIIRENDHPAGEKQPGRKPVYFCIAPKSTPENYLGLSRALLTLLTSKDNCLSLSTLTLSLSAGFSAPQRFPLRLNAAIRFLNQRHYAARWEAHSSAPQIIFLNCPYEQMRFDFPILCQIDHQFISTLLALDPGSVIPHICQQKPFSKCIFDAYFEPSKR